MDCKAVQKVIYRFVYGESSSSELVQVKSHLDRCRECESERELIGNILAKIQQVAASETADELPAGCRERILAAIRSNLSAEQSEG